MIAPARKARASIAFFLLLLTLLLSLPSPLPAQTIKIPPHQKIVMKNGLTVLLMEKRGVPIVSFAALVKSGAAADPIGQEGLASQTAALLRKGTSKRSAQQFAADLDFIGGSFEADAGADFTLISAEFLTKDLNRGLDLFTDALLRPAFPQEEVDKSLAQTLDAVKGLKDDPRQVLSLYYNGYLYGGKGYGRPDDGDDISLKRINRDAIARFYAANYAPGNTILAVVGEFNAADLRTQLEATFGAWPAKAVAPVAIPAIPAARGKRLLLIDKPDASQTYFAIGNIETAAGDPDRVAIRVVNTIFGGRFTSMLNEAMRVESGLTYGVASTFDPRKVPGPFRISSFTKNDSTVAAIDMALDILHKLHKDGVTPEQLASAKSYIKGQFPPTIETSRDLAQQLADNEFYGLDDSEVDQLEARIDAVTVDMARQAIQKHFPEDNLVFVLIGKSAAIAPAVKKYAEKQDAREISAPGFWPGTATSN
jgi:predicted Zn-dependent peptidase